MRSETGSASAAFGLAVLFGLVGLFIGGALGGRPSPDSAFGGMDSMQRAVNGALLGLTLGVIAPLRTPDPQRS